MANSDSTVKFRADISQLKSAMQQASRQVRLASSEFKAATAGLDDWSSSAEGLNAKVKQLNSTLTAQKRQVELANKAYEETVKVYGKGSAEADRAKISLNNYEAAVAKTEAELNKYEQELKDCEESTGRFADETDDLDSATQKASDGFTVMKGALASLVADGIRIAIDAMKDLAKQTFEAGMNFESAMSQVEAISGASAEEMDLLTQKAKEMGETTKFSASESAEAFNYMAMAGWKTEDMLNGIEGVMNLAAASGTDLATTSDIVTDALTAMGYSAGDAGRLADVMAAASANANTNVAMMGQTFQYAAPLAGALGYSMEDVAVAIGLMANAGIKGEKAGTALRSTFTRLSAPPKECADAMGDLEISLTDAQGNMKDLDVVMGDLREAFAGLSETQQTEYAKAIAGQEAMAGLLAIVNAAPEDFDKLTEAVRNSNGAASDMATIMQDNVGGQITLLKSKVEGIMIKVFENASDSIRTSIDTISQALDKVDWDKFGQKVGKVLENVVNFFIKIVENADGIVSVLKSIGTVLIATFVVNKIAAFVTAIVSMVSTFRALKTATEAATTAQQLLNLAQAATPIGLITAAVAGLTTGLIYLATKSKDVEEVTADLTEEQSKQIETIHEQAKAYDDLRQAQTDSISAMQSEYGYYNELLDELDQLVDANGKVKEGYEDRASFIIETLNKALGTELELTDGLIENYVGQKEALEELIEIKKAEAILSANEQAYTEAIQGRQDALTSYVEAQDIYKQKLEEMTAAEQKYNELAGMTVEQYAQMHGGMMDTVTANQLLNAELTDAQNNLKSSQLAVTETRSAYKEAEDTYIGYANTISNYEKLQTAVIKGNADETAKALTQMTYNFIDAEHGTEETLRKQVSNLESTYESMKKAVEDGSGAVTQAQVDEVKDMLDQANAEYKKFEAESSKNGQNTSKKYAEGITKGKGDATKAASGVSSGALSAMSTAEFNSAGQAAASSYGAGMSSQSGAVANASAGIGSTANKNVNRDTNTYSSGQNFTQGYINGMGSLLADVGRAAYNLGQTATKKLKQGQKEGSPSKITTQSGKFFGEGYIIGMESEEKSIAKTAMGLGTTAVESLREAQKEGSPSKLTYQSGVNFVAGYINGIGSMEKALVSTVKSMTNSALKAALNVKDYDFTTAGENAGKIFSDAIAKKISFTTEKIQYQNEQKIKDFDNTIQALQDQMSKTTDENQKKAYQNQIAEQQRIKASYQSASTKMIQEFTSALNTYQSKANELINSTVSGIATKYQNLYNELENKQNDLVNKLKGTGTLFDISGAGILTVNDITEQTKQLQEYSSKLMSIKSKVSSALFDEIAGFDVTEGSAFMDRLLSMSDADLKAYSAAYDQKMKVSEAIGAQTYKSDINKVVSEYKASLTKAFKTLPSQMESLGVDAMKGFLTGFTEKTSYMDSYVKTFVSGMVATFKKELKIASPSKVMMQIGEYTGEGFVEGMKDMLGQVASVASDYAQTVASPLDMNAGSLGIGSLMGTNRTMETSVVNNYNLVQNNTSPKSLSALETYNARRQQIAMMKAVTQ